MRAVTVVVLGMDVITLFLLLAISGPIGHTDWQVAVAWLSVLLIANAGVCLWALVSIDTTRIGKLLSLWLSAKERELTQRAGKTDA